ncbi:hypothetical protein FGG08_004153 [Glutinoglossum americanum]|uniref:Uncharacterized protein n=1 Tax=Glutinoglossum americanum TaxID=1670608 RepID=A0A9P8L308_9PEZI|nr:hypothetical protein FGG08_004153 [Glutinoglossum americanum]
MNAAQNSNPQSWQLMATRQDASELKEEIPLLEAFGMLPLELRIKTYEYIIGTDTIFSFNKFTPSIIMLTKRMSGTFSQWFDSKLEAGYSENEIFKIDEEWVLSPDSNDDHLYEPLYFPPQLRSDEVLWAEFKNELWSCSHIVVLSIWELGSVLTLAGPNGRRCLREITFTYSGTTKHEAVSAFELLAQCRQLQKLHIVVDQEMSTKPMRKPLALRRVKDCQGMNALRKVKVWGSLEILGDCIDKAELEEWLKKKMLQQSTLREPSSIWKGRLRLASRD